MLTSGHRHQILVAFSLLGLAIFALWMFVQGYGTFLPIILVIVIITLLAVKFTSFAWCAYFLSMSMTGAVLDLGPASVRAEIFALPLLVICIVRIRSGSDLKSSVAGLGAPTALLSVAYFVWATMTTVVNAPTPGPSLWILIQIFTGFLAFACLRVDDSEKFKMITAGSLILGSIAGLSLLSWLGRTYLGLPAAFTPGVAADGRLIGFSLETNIFASQCVGWVALCSRWWGALGPRVRLANVLLCMSVILAGTRAAWIALLFVLAVSGLEGARKSYKWIWGMMLGAGTVVLLLPTATFGESADRNSLNWRLGNLFNTDEGTGAYRAGIYETALADIDSIGRALVGSGINSFSQFHLIDPTGVSASYLSSIWIAVLYDTGFVGSFLFFGLLLSIVLSCNRLRDGVVVAVALLVCASATNLIWFQYPWIYLALLVFKKSAETPGLNYRGLSGSGRRLQNIID